MLITRNNLQLLFYLLILFGCAKDKYSMSDGESIFSLSSSARPDPRLQNYNILTPAAEETACYSASDFDIKHQGINHLYNGDFMLKKVANLGFFNMKTTLNFKTTPVICNNSLYYLDSTGNITMYTINKKGNNESLAKKWSFQMNLTNNDKKTFFSGDIKLHNGTLFASSNNGHIIAIDAVTGKQLWRQKFSQSFNSSATISNNGQKLFINSGSDVVMALSTFDGSLLWKHEVSDTNIVTSYDVAPVVLYGDDYLVSTLSNGEVLMLSQHTGALKWRYKIFSNRVSGNIVDIADIDFAPLIVDDIIVVGGIKTSVIGINANTGVPLWQINSSLNSNFLHNNKDFGFFVNAEGNLMAFHIKTGMIKWIYDQMPATSIYDVPAYTNYGSETFVKRLNRFYPVMINGSIFINDSLANMYEIDSESGELLELHHSTYNTHSNLIVEGNKIYLLDDFNNLYVMK